MKIAAALFEPDKSRYNLGASQELMNVLPVADGWAPMPSPSALTPALYVLTDEDGNPLLDENGHIIVELVSGAVVDGDILLPTGSRGGIFVRLANGSTRLFVGTETTLYEFNYSDLYWQDVSGPSAPYSAQDRWSFALYGSTLYCQNGSDPEQMFDIGTDTAFSDNASAPVASYLAVVADFIMRGRLASDVNSIQWSALNDPTSNTIGVDLSDVQPFGEGNGIQGIIPLSSGAAIFLRDEVSILNYPDSAYVFRRSAVTLYRGAMAPGSICSIGQDDFVFYGADGFFRGLGMTAIGAERVDRWILSVCDQTARENMISAPDFRRKIVWFRVQATDGSYLLLGYDWQLDRWCQSNADLADMFRLETVGVTIDGLGNLFETFDDIDVPFDSSLFDGGSVEFGGVDSNGNLVYLYGDPMEATITTNEASLNGTNRAIVNGGRLDGDAVNFSAALATGEFKGGDLTNRAAVTPSVRTRFIPFRGDGRVHKVTITIPQGESWSIFQGIDLDATGTGKS
jgi:hypothetical protein